MTYQNVFKRYELKYLISTEQKQRILKAMEPYMALDQYGRTTIRNVYFDTESYRLIRRSLERPSYKEKLRIRSYRQVGPEHFVYVELKKKYDHVVYKRRIALPEQEAMDWLCGKKHCGERCQITEEVDYFLRYYEGLRPVAFISYEREAYYTREKSDFRVTFDDEILFRQENLSLEAEIGGIPLLEPGKILMEIKCSGGIPLWMVRLLSEERIYKTTFSKYGTAYRNWIFPKLKEAANYGNVV